MAVNAQPRPTAYASERGSVFPMAYASETVILGENPSLGVILFFISRFFLLSKSKPDVPAFNRATLLHSILSLLLNVVDRADGE